MNLSDSPGRPACPSRASGWPSLTTPWGLPCCVRFPCVHAVATTPAQRLGVSFAHSPSRISLPRKGQSGRPAHRPFRGLLGVHSRYGLHTRAVTVYRDTLTEGFSHSSIAAPVASGWSGCRVGLAPTGKRRLSTAHTQLGHRPPFTRSPRGRGRAASAEFRCRAPFAVTRFRGEELREGAIRRSWADCITNTCGSDLRQAQAGLPTFAASGAVGQGASAVSASLSSAMDHLAVLQQSPASGVAAGAVGLNL